MQSLYTIHGKSDSVMSISFTHGIQALGAKEYANAIACFQRALAEEPNHEAILYYLGKAYLYQKDAENAISYLDKHLAVHTDCTDCLDSLGNAYEWLGDLQQAEEYYNRAIQQNNNVSSLHNRGILKFRQGKLDEAFVDLSLALSLANDSNNKEDLAHILHSLANVYDQQGDHDQAVESYSKAKTLTNSEELIAAINDDYCEALASIGHTFYTKANYEQARIYYQEALSLDRLHPAALLQLGMTWYKQKDFKTAKQIFNDAIKKLNDIDAWINRASCLRKDGHLTFALGSLNTARMLITDDNEEILEEIQLGEHKIREIAAQRIQTTHKNFINRLTEKGFLDATQRIQYVQQQTLNQFNPTDNMKP